MRTTITIGKKHDGKRVVIHGPEVSIRDQRRWVKGLKVGGKVHPDYSEVSIVEPIRTLELKRPAAAKPKEQKPKETPTEGVSTSGNNVAAVVSELQAGQTEPQTTFAARFKRTTKKKVSQTA